MTAPESPRPPDEAMWVAADQLALYDAKLARIHQLVEQWERYSAELKQAPRPDANRGWGRNEYVMRSYTAGVYGDVTRALREILDGE